MTDTDGTSSSVVEGSISGYEIVDYVLRANKGQHMNVSMTTDNTINYFNILAPVDEFHISGRKASEEFIGQLELSADNHALDVGCGIGGNVISSNNLGSGSAPACTTGNCCPGGVCGLN